MANAGAETSRIRDGVRDSKIRLDIPLKVDLKFDSFVIEPNRYSDWRRHDSYSDTQLVDGVFPHDAKAEVDGGCYHRRGTVRERNRNWFRSILPIYSGSQFIEDLWAWIDEIEDYFAEMQPPERLKCKIASYTLEGAADRWWCQLEHHSFSWWRMKHLLAKRFIHVKCSRKCSTEVYNSSKYYGHCISESLLQQIEEGNEGVKHRIIDTSVPVKCSAECPFGLISCKHDGTTKLGVSDASEVLYEGDEHPAKMSEEKPTKRVMEFSKLSINETTKDKADRGIQASEMVEEIREAPCVNKQGAVSDLIVLGESDIVYKSGCWTKASHVKDSQDSNEFNEVDFASFIPTQNVLNRPNATKIMKTAAPFDNIMPDQRKGNITEGREVGIKHEAISKIMVSNEEFRAGNAFFVLKDALKRSSCDVDFLVDKMLKLSFDPGGDYSPVTLEPLQNLVSDYGRYLGLKGKPQVYPITRFDIVHNRDIVQNRDNIGMLEVHGSNHGEHNEHILPDKLPPVTVKEIVAPTETEGAMKQIIEKKGCIHENEVSMGKWSSKKHLETLVLSYSVSNMVDKNYTDKMTKDRKDNRALFCLSEPFDILVWERRFPVCDEKRSSFHDVTERESFNNLCVRMGFDHFNSETTLFLFDPGGIHTFQNLGFYFLSNYCIFFMYEAVSGNYTDEKRFGGLILSLDSSYMKLKLERPSVIQAETWSIILTMPCGNLKILVVDEADHMATRDGLQPLNVGLLLHILIPFDPGGIVCFLITWKSEFCDLALIELETKYGEQGLACMHDNIRFLRCLGPSSVVINIMVERGAALLVQKLENHAFSVEVRFPNLVNNNLVEKASVSVFESLFSFKYVSPKTIFSSPDNYEDKNMSKACGCNETIVGPKMGDSCWVLWAHVKNKGSLFGDGSLTQNHIGRKFTTALRRQFYVLMLFGKSEHDHSVVSKILVDTTEGFVVGTDIASSPWLRKGYNIGCKVANVGMMAVLNGTYYITVLNVLKNSEIIKGELVSIAGKYVGIDLELAGHYAIFGEIRTEVPGVLSSDFHFDNYDTIKAKLSIVTISSCLGVLCTNEQSREPVTLFYKVVNGLDPPTDLDGAYESSIGDANEFDRFARGPMNLICLLPIIFPSILMVLISHSIRALMMRQQRTINSRTSYYFWGVIEMM